MKRLPLIICLVFVFITLSSCNMGKTDGVDISIGKSVKFRKAEIRSAVDCVIRKFWDFSGCTLTKIWYDEEWSNRVVESYISNGNGSQNGVKSDNVIVLFSDFDVDSTGGDGSFEPDSTCTGWNWILIRDSETSGWRVDDWGF